MLNLVHFSERALEVLDLIYYNPSIAVLSYQPYPLGFIDDIAPVPDNDVIILEVFRLPYWLHFR